MNLLGKIGYTLLGAGLVVIGIAIGQYVIPKTEPQRSEVVEKLVCRELEVVDKAGNTAIRLRSEDKANMISVYGQQDNVVMILGSIDEQASGLSIYDRFGRLMIGLTSAAGWDNLQGSGLSIYDIHGRNAIELTSTLGGDAVKVYDNAGNVAAELSSDEDNWLSLEPIWKKRKEKEAGFSSSDGD